MRRQSEAEKARRARAHENFKAGMCLQDCGRPMDPEPDGPCGNLCRPCAASLVRQYFTRIGEPVPEWAREEEETT